MNRKINVLDVQLDDYTAKEAMKAATEYMNNEALNTIELVTADILVRVAEDPVLKDNLEQLDIVLAGDEAILEAAGISEKRRLQEAENQTFLKLLIHYFHKNHATLFLLADKEEELQSYGDYLTQKYSGLKVVGAAVVPQDDSADDMITNRINGSETEVDCIVSIVATPGQEAFISRCRTVLNAKLWLGVGKGASLIRHKEGFRERFADFVEKKILKREIEREKKKKPQP